MSFKPLVVWISRLVAAGLLLQTLFFKFTAHPDSVYLFSLLGVEPFGRIVLGIIELLVGLAILIPRTSRKGAIGAIIIMLGAILSHVFVIGIDFNNDGGMLFGISIVVLIASILVAVLSKKKS